MFSVLDPDVKVFKDVDDNVIVCPSNILHECVTKNDH